jgi:hypothetical protein
MLNLHVGPAEEVAEPERPFDYFCGVCGSQVAQGKIPTPRAGGICGGCATILNLVEGEPFATRADLSKVPLRDRAQLEARAEQVRKARGLPPPIIVSR